MKCPRVPGCCFRALLLTSSIRGAWEEPTAWSQSASALWHMACLQMTAMGLQSRDATFAKDVKLTGMINLTEGRSRSPENLNREKQWAFSKKIKCNSCKCKVLKRKICNDRTGVKVTESVAWLNRSIYGDSSWHFNLDFFSYCKLSKSYLKWLYKNYSQYEIL